MIRQNFATFQQQNRVHFVADLRTMSGNEATIQGRNIGLFQNMVVIDTNKNGRGDVHGAEDGSKVVYNVVEPTFISSYRALREMAQRNGTHIIRQDDVRPVKMGQPGYTVNKWIWDRNIAGPHTNRVRTLDSVIDEIGAFPIDAKWALDTDKHRFIIYSPGRPYPAKKFQSPMV